MSSIRQRDTAPEIAVRHVLRHLSVGYRTQARDLSGSPDIVNRGERWAIFVHGCFWHGHDCDHGRRKSKTNTEFWTEKVAKNRTRDARKCAQLQEIGFSVLEIWECETRERIRLRKILSEFIRIARARLECFQLDGLGQRIVRMARVDRARSRKTEAKISEPPEQVLSPNDAFDHAWLIAKQKPAAARNGAGSVTLADLFCGCGGFSLGVEEACRASGRYFQPVLAADIDSRALAVYSDNFAPHITLSETLESKLDGGLGAPATFIEQEFLAPLPPIDILVAGAPCQGHSNLNNHTRRNDDRNLLYLRIARFAELARPAHILIENVASVIHDAGRVMHETRAYLEQFGYRCDAGTVELWRLGVPQIRKRHLLVASLTEAIDIDAVVNANSVAKPRTVGWAIGDLEDVREENRTDGVRSLSDENQARIRWMFENDAYDLPNALRPPCHRDNNHKYLAMYGRLRTNRPANTVTTGFGSPGQGRYVHPTRPRTLTAHEAARLQMFPDFFEFSAAQSYQSLAKMIGNAVPMKLSYLFTLALLSGRFKDTAGE